MTPLDLTSPYRGLTPYTEDDAAYFFGRTTEIATVAASLAVARLTIFYGPTGVGKSSLLRAGVIHQLQQQASTNLSSSGCPEVIPVYFNHWQQDPLTGLLQAIASAVQPYLAPAALPLLPQPEATPAASSALLATQLRAWSEATGSDLLIVLDQFEEYFLYQPSADKVGHFADAVVQAINSPELHANFLFSLREDALARLDRFKEQIAFLFNNRLSMTHLRREQGYEAVTRPLLQFNCDHHATYAIEAALTEAVLEQVARGKVALVRQGATISTAEVGYIEAPYLQLVLTRVWNEEQARQSLMLRQQTLDELGGAQTIVATYLDNTMSSLPATQQAIAARFFDRLVTLGGAKIALSLHELIGYAHAPAAEVEALLEQLQDKRLVRGVQSLTGTVQYEIFHDVLAQAVVAWQGRYQQAQQEAERLHVVQAERAAAEDRAAQAAARAELEERARQEAQARAESEKSNSRRLRWLLGVMVVLFLATGGLAMVAWNAQKKAEEQRRVAKEQQSIAETQELRARSGELAAQAITAIQSDPELGILLALEAISTTQTASAEDALRRSLLASSVVTTLIHDQPVFTVAFSPDGRKLISAAQGGQIRIWDANTYQALGHLTGHYDTAVKLAYDPKGNQIASAHYDGTVLLWNAHTGFISHILPGHSKPAWAVNFSSDGLHLASGNGDGTAIIWDALSGRSVQTLSVTSAVRGVAFNHDGKLLATVSQDGVAQVWELSTGSVVFSKTHANALYGVAFRSTDDLLAVSGQDQRVTIWQLKEPQKLVAQLSNSHSNTVSSVDFSSDGKRLVSADFDGTAIIWDVSDLATIFELKRLKGHQDKILSVVFDRDGLRVATASYDQSVKLWTASAHHAGINDLTFDKNSGRLVTASKDGTARLWAFQESHLTLLKTLPHGAEVDRAVFSPDGQHIATAGNDGIVNLWDVSSGNLLGRFKGHTDLVNSVAFSHDGTRLATASYDGRAGIWDVRSGQRIRFLKDADAIVNDIAFSADDRLLATASGDKLVRLWQVDTGKVIQIFSGHSAAVQRVAFSPDGSTLATASSDRTARLWNPLTATAIVTFTEHSERIFGLAYDVTGRRLATAGTDGRIVVHEIATGKSQVLSAGKVAYGVVFSPDGQYILFAGKGDDVNIQALSVADLVAQAQMGLTRSWRLQECQQYLDMQNCPHVATPQR